MQHPCRMCKGFGDVPFPCGISFGCGDHDLSTNLACFLRLRFAAGDAFANAETFVTKKREQGVGC